MRVRWRAFLFGGLAFLGVTAGASAEAPSAAQRAQALEIYRSVVGVESSTGAQTQALAEQLATRFRNGGFAAEDVHVLALANTAGLLVRYRGNGGGGRPILLLAHMDVVPARRAEWERDPFTLVEEDGYFFGRGSIDNKSGLTLITTTLLQLRAEDFRPTRDLIVWFSGDEETSGNSTRLMLEQHRDLIGDAEFALNSDAGGGLLSHEGAPTAYFMQTAEKSYASYTLTARNPGGHSSLPRRDNAIYDLVDALQRVRGYTFP